MSYVQSTEQETLSQRATTLAKPLAPEDVLRGDYVTPLHTLCEVPSFYWCDGEWQRPREEPVRMQFMASEAGVPLKVKRVCLPFVVVEHPLYGGQTIDLRRSRVARLDAKYAKAAWKALKKAQRLSEAPSTR